jgi:triacylglycerol lipase
VSESASHVGWMLREAPLPVDATSQFLELYAAPRAIHAPVLLVGGIFTERYPGYLMRIRSAVGASVIPIDTDQDLMRNAVTIRDAVLGAAARVVLVGQSKGPLDIHAALSLHPEIVPHVRAFVSIQAPFGGTPLASDAEASRAGRWLVGGLVGGMFRGTPRAYFDMGYAARRAFLARFPAPVQVPTVALATWTTRPGLFLHSTHRYLSRYGVPTDGFVLLPDAHVPGARLVTLDGMDHASLALRWLRPRARFEPGRVAQALVSLALE